MHESTPPPPENTLPVFVNQTGLAGILGISRQRVHQLKSSGQLPAPDGILENVGLIWTLETAQNFFEERNRALGKIGLQE